nr:Ig-like domain-containing protein [bacterium]
TINESTVLLTDVDCEVSYNEETMTAVLTPKIKLTHSTLYNIIITDAVKDIAGTSIGSDVIINFTTAEE